MGSRKKRGKAAKVRNYTQDEIKSACLKYMVLQTKNAAIKLAMEHFTFTEIRHDGLNIYFEEAEKEVSEFETLLSLVFENAATQADVEDAEANAVAEDVEANAVAEDAEANAMAEDAEANAVAEDAEANAVAEDAEATDAGETAENKGSFESVTQAVSKAEILERIATLRNRIIKISEIITGYADKFSIYEYVFNRLEYNFTSYENVPDDVATKQTLEFIFESDDNMLVNTRLLSVIGQLPIRMTKNHLCDLIIDGCKVYKGSEKSSYDGFLDNLREAAGLKRISHAFAYYDKFEEEVDFFSNLNIKEINENEFDELQERLEFITGELVSLSDIYFMLMSMINALYVICLSDSYGIKISKDLDESIIIRATYALFNDTPSDVWDVTNPEGDGFADRLESLNPFFDSIIGQQEVNSEQSEMLYSVINHIVGAQKDDVYAAFGIKGDAAQNQAENDIVRALDMISKLSGSSEFMELSDDEDISLGEKYEKKTENDELDLADNDYILKNADAFCYELKEKLKGCDRRVARAIMAAILEKLPVFFREAKEVAEYIKDSLSSCDDENEKQACINAINMLIDSAK
ncbi:MAG: hypothetical protein K6G11_01370 [Lachnospiraceae bacterium]|nr:hypothetical protein [Lachnospiraceae bacterium]